MTDTSRSKRTMTVRPSNRPFRDREDRLQRGKDLGDPCLDSKTQVLIRRVTPVRGVQC